MVKQIVRDPLFLQQKSEAATESDKPVIVDLIEDKRAGIKIWSVLSGHLSGCTI